MSIFFRLKENLKIIILTILFLYILINLFGGQRGLFSYIEKREVLKNLQFEERQMLKKLKRLN